MFPARSFHGKRVGLFGLARSGLSAATALRLGGAEVFAWDDSDPAVAKAKVEGCAVTNLHDVDFARLDALVLSPGVPLTHPEPHWTVVKARTAGIEVIGDTEIFAREAVAAGAKLVCITGTNGKSTTTALTGHMLKACGLDAEVGGNIGNAVFNLTLPAKSKVYVLELSSFQIDLMPSLKPDVGILTNITPDHLDRHGTIENYAAVKARIFAKMGVGSTALIGVDDVHGEAIFAAAPKAAMRLPVSVLRDLQNGISAPQGILHDRRANAAEEQLDLRAMTSLRGRHNWQNACMAFGAAKHFGIATEKIAAAMKTFPGLAHRMQQIASIGQVAFVNDSKATNADAAEKALSSFTNIYWIAGGIAKAGGIESLRPLFPNITKAYLIGAAAKDFAKTLDPAVPVEISGTLDAAVAAAAHDAAISAKPAVVLLSPACASFDQYKNFEVRGDAFVAAVSKLPNAVMTGA